MLLCYDISYIKIEFKYSVKNIYKKINNYIQFILKNKIINNYIKFISLIKYNKTFNNKRLF